MWDGGFGMWVDGTGWVRIGELLTEEKVVPEGYQSLEIYQIAHRLAIEIHKMTLTLPRHEMYEEGGQVRRSSKSVSAQIVEGYCLRKNKNEFLQYLHRAHASAHETVEHLQFLWETGSLTDKLQHEHLIEEYEILCRKIYRFLEAVHQSHGKPGFLRGT